MNLKQLYPELQKKFILLQEKILMHKNEVWYIQNNVRLATLWFERDIYGKVKYFNEQEYKNWGKNFAKQFIKNLEWQRKVHDEFDCELVWLEDRYDKEVKYNPKYDVTLPQTKFWCRRRGSF